jgi:selenocysteine lyase/cysteine desulfurase
LASDRAGNLLFDKIEKQLASAPTPNIIVSVSAASNVTSKITNLEKLNETIKKVRKSKNVILALDCAAYCCHHELNLEKNNQIDFVYLSPHKNLGGAESCGVLIARKNIVRNAKPTFPGGGTVAFVKGYSKEDIMYDVDIFNR